MGRPIEGNGDPLACASALEYYAVSHVWYIGVDASKLNKLLLQALALNVSGHTSLLSPGQLNMTLRQPFGVCAGIVCVSIALKTRNRNIERFGLRCTSDSLECTWNHVHCERNIQVLVQVATRLT